ncbi:MAG: ribulose-phosphate 3-epimerase [Planctomycetota bacterium]|jgi:ribulose-phosphate 3-epimerase|nr:ribulose-phosphate 3-epimerase [Planctomycetota bacterium]
MRRVVRNPVTLSASVSCMDLMHLADDLDKVKASPVSFLHFDVVDGEFNSCFILGGPTLAALRKGTELPIEAHLAVMRPELFLRQYVDAGADYVAFHAETQNAAETLRLCGRVRDLGAAPILALRAETNLDDSYIPVLGSVEWVLKLLVQPGHAGQKLGAGSIDSLGHIAGLLRRHAPGVGLQADGNVNLDTIPAIVAAGADILTGGTSGLFRGGDIAANARAMLARAAGA